MGREIRRVPADWKHPVTGPISCGQPRHKPLFKGERFQNDVENWDEENAEWAKGNFPSSADEEDRKAGYEVWVGCKRPDPKKYMPVWTPEEATHYMLYENTSEGTPESPAFATPEELARWLADNKVSSFGRHHPLTYDVWLKFCQQEGVSEGTFVMTTDGDTISGVQASVESKLSS